MKRLLSLKRILIVLAMISHLISYAEVDDLTQTSPFSIDFNPQNLLAVASETHQQPANIQDVLHRFHSHFLTTFFNRRMISRREIDYDKLLQIVKQNQFDIKATELQSLIKLTKILVNYEIIRIEYLKFLQEYRDEVKKSFQETKPTIISEEMWDQYFESTQLDLRKQIDEHSKRIKSIKPGYKSDEVYQKLKKLKHQHRVADGQLKALLRRQKNIKANLKNLQDLQHELKTLTNEYEKEFSIYKGVSDEKIFTVLSRIHETIKLLKEKYDVCAGSL